MKERVVIKPFWFMVKRDLISGTFFNWPKFIFAAAIFAFLTIVNVLHIQVESNILDYLFEAFKGIGYERQFSITWLTIQLYIAYIIGSYIVDDLLENGTYVLSRSGSRIKWWISKTIWMFISVLCFYGIAVITIGAVVYFSPAELSLKWSTYAEKAILPLSDIKITPFFFLLRILVLAVVSSVAIGTVQICLSLIINPLFSYLAITVIWFATFFFFSPYLPGTNAMILRQNIFSSFPSVTLTHSVIYNSVVILFFFVLGAFHFKNRDILSKQDIE